MSLLDPSRGLMFWTVIMAVSWIIPLVFMIWFIRTLNAMVEAQRAIAEQLGIMTEQNRSGVRSGSL